MSAQPHHLQAEAMATLPLQRPHPDVEAPGALPSRGPRRHVAP
jgi:hypothetical protein